MLRDRIRVNILRVRLPLNVVNVADKRAAGRALIAPYYGWVLVGALGVTEVISWGVLYYAFSVFLTPMETDLGSRAETTGAFSLALLLDLRTGEVLARGASMTRWLPYGAALLELAACEPYGGRLRRTDELTAFFDAIVSDVDDGIDTLVITHAQNLRSALPWIGNGGTEPDTFAGIDISRYSGLRHSRRRTNVEHETPEYFGIADDQVTVGLPSGVWLVDRYPSHRAVTPPLPCHLAQQTAEYLLPIEDDEDER